MQSVAMVGPVPWRRTFLVAGVLVAAAGLTGAIQLATGRFAPPTSDLEPLGLTSWKLPAVWLFVSVVVPWSVVALLAARRARATTRAVIVAAAALVVELLVQIPFVGLNPMQPALGAVAVALGLMAVRTRPSRLDGSARAAIRGHGGTGRTVSARG